MQAGKEKSKELDRATQKKGQKDFKVMKSE